MFAHPPRRPGTTAKPKLAVKPASAGVPFAALLGEHRVDALNDNGGAAVRRLGEKQRKLVPADAKGCVRAAQRAREDGGESNERLVSRRVTETGRCDP